jgi:hypothetical protein
MAKKKSPIIITEINKELALVKESQIIDQIKHDLDSMDNQELIKIFKYLYKVECTDTDKGIELQVNAEKKAAGYTLKDIFVSYK